ncbi:MAG: GAF domain-containing protein [Lachnospirales bacterium]
MYKIKKEVNRDSNYKYLLYAAQDLIETEEDFIAILSNLSAFINEYVDDINWVGFYLLKNNELILGPFQGSPACIHIQLGKGVCGTAAASKKTILVANVDEFTGHIACDSRSKSELVVPIFKNNEIYGVLDIDSPTLNRFSKVEQILFEKIISVFENKLTWFTKIL